MIRSLLMLVTAAWLLVPGTTRGEPDAHFHMTGTLQGAGTLDPACNGFRYATAGPFDGTPLGPVHWMGSQCVDAVSNPGGFALAGTFSFDDGLLVGGYQGHAGLPDAAGRVYGWGTFSITGGSGAYAGATGTGIFTVDAQPLTSTAHFELIGRSNEPHDREGGKTPHGATSSVAMRRAMSRTVGERVGRT